jgi:hypothetical protein
MTQAAPVERSSLVQIQEGLRGAQRATNGRNIVLLLAGICWRGSVPEVSVLVLTSRAKGCGP